MVAKKVKTAKTVKTAKVSSKKVKSSKAAESPEIKKNTQVQSLEQEKIPAKKNGLTYQQAKDYVSSIRNFYQHLIVFLVIISFLFFFNFMTSPNTLWVIWVIFGWGLGVILHGLSVFVWSSARSMKWENEMIEKLLEESKIKKN